MTRLFSLLLVAFALVFTSVIASNSYAVGNAAPVDATDNAVAAPAADANAAPAKHHGKKHAGKKHHGKHHRKAKTSEDTKTNSDPAATK